MALLDMLGVASIMPFMAVLANPGLADPTQSSKPPTLPQASSALIPRAIPIRARYPRFRALVGLAGVKALTTYAQLRFTMVREYSIGKRLVEGYLHQPYSWFLSRHSADLGKNILVEVGTVISNGFTPMMTLIAQGTVAITLLILLILIDPKLALISASP